MPRYHVNPESGNPNQCRAMVQCPFGDLDSDHFDSKDAARRAYEAGEVRGTVPAAAKKEKTLEVQVKETKDAERQIQSRIGKMMKQYTDVGVGRKSIDTLLKTLKNMPFDSDDDRKAEAAQLSKIKTAAEVREKELDRDLTALRLQASGITKKIQQLEAELRAERRQASPASKPIYTANW